MAGIYFSRVTARGKGKRDSFVDFTPGLNIICGHSNTGKTAIARCIDFALGKIGDFPIDETFGYDQVELLVQAADGTISITRKFHKDQVDVITNIPGMISDKYNLKYSQSQRNGLPVLSDLLLSAMGIPVPCMVIKNIDFKRAPLTLRTFLHMLIFLNNDIGKVESVLEPKESIQKTVFLSSLLFLMTGSNFPEHDEQTKKEIRIAERNAILRYVNRQISNVAEKKKVLQKQMMAFQGIDVEQQMTSLIAGIEQTESAISAALSRRQDLVQEMSDLQEKVTEAELMKSRYATLKSQYTADIKRLTFIADGEMSRSVHDKNNVCPFCESHFTPKDDETYIESARGELSRILAQMNDLTKAEQSLAEEMRWMSEEMAKLDAEKDSIESHIQQELRPKAEAMRKSLADYKSFLQLKREMSVIDDFAVGWEADLRNPPVEPESALQYHPREHFDDDFKKLINQYYKDILHECSYMPEPTTTNFNISDFDIEIDGHKKSAHEGQGYTSFVNSVTALTFRHYLAHHAKYYPGFLIIDTPLLGLDQGVADSAPESMCSGLFRYFMNHQKEGQLIIIENSKNLPDLDYAAAGANVITFTKGLAEGRFGFLHDVVE
ncbi:AAA family ATPase [uncultured Selenomonas sp.]|uniref:AAA family ATPase n=1 Tax=uncultured Selenomonas sp. TaxID=159275 RepID=UPI002675E79C|nr:AAA family ATPase [uncultured Selenomonas sp.]